PPVLCVSFSRSGDRRALPSFPTRRSSDLIQPQVAVLESLVNPTSDQLLDRNAMSQSGTLEIAPMEAPLALFVWGKNRIVPVRVRSEEYTSELQSRENLVCRLLLEKKKEKN